MTGAQAIVHAEAQFDSGEFELMLARRVSIPTESQNPKRTKELHQYLNDEMIPAFSALGLETRIIRHGKAPGPFLFAQRTEDRQAVTVPGYGHGDVILGLDAAWKEGLSPRKLTEVAGRWYGRGVADNKGQHSVNLAAMRAVLETRGRLGFNAKYLIDMGEEIGSPGLREICMDNCELFSGDLFMASDGPRLSAARPTVFLGARGGLLIDLSINAREGGHHSGNWGGLLSNPGIQLAHAIASIVGPNGQIRVPAILPNLGGALPNDIFSEGLGLPTVWVSHSYPGCSQHAPNEHVPAELFRESLAIMAGLYWDLGETEAIGKS
jgi:acetylornithine deacetylase/succinyl-diaminopimelate desuccinylase-like protein